MRARAAAVWLVVAGAASAGPLTATETRWLQGAWPVVQQAQAAGLPLDIVVQPQATPGLPPLALAWVAGRCKLVLSMRGNDAAQATLDRLEPTRANATLGLMTAHEMGHCSRHVQGFWQTLPSAGAATPPPAGDTDRAQMEAVRREEAYGDLVGLAWVQRWHPAHYAALHAWLVRERQRDNLPGSHHDTLPWLLLAADGRVFDGAASIYEAADRLWREGLGRAP